MGSGLKSSLERKPPCIIVKRWLKAIALGALNIRLLVPKALSGILNIHVAMTYTTMLLRTWATVIET